MKKIFVFLAAAAALVAAASCSQKELNEASVSDVKLVPTTFSAVIDQTKATADILGKITWEKGDQIAAVFTDVQSGKATAYTLTITEGAGTNAATFEGNCPEDAFPTVFDKAVYPAEAYGSDDAVVYEQTIAPSATCDHKALVLQGAMESGSIHFAPAVGGVQFDVPAGVSKVSLATDKGTFSATIPDAGKYFIFMPAGEYKALTAIANVAGQTFGYSSTKSMNVTAGKVFNLGDLSSKLAPVAAIVDAVTLEAYLANPATDGFIMNDIDLTGVSHTPCASLDKTLNGLGHSLKNWNCTAPLISNLAEGGVVENITLDASVGIAPESCYDFGALVGIAAAGSKVLYCTNNADVTINDETGARSVMGILVGRSNNAYLEGCVNNGDLTVSLGGLADTQYFGCVLGLLGTPATGAIRMRDCVNNGDLFFEVTGATGKNSYIGGVVGSTGVNAVKDGATTKDYGIVESCTNNGKVTIKHPNGGSGIYFNTGGVIGYCEGELRNCTNNGDISLYNSMTVNSTRPAIGGVCGTITIAAQNCTNRGNVHAEGLFANGTATTTGAAGVIVPSVAGVFGVVGNTTLSNTCVIDGCVNEGTVTVNFNMPSGNKSTFRVGGITAQSYAIIKNCTNSGNVDAVLGSYGNGIGGIAGYTFSSVEKCTNSGNITVSGVKGFTGNQSYQYYQAGIVGNMASATATTMKDCENTGDVVIKDIANSVYSYIGSFIGNYAKQVQVTNCHAVCDVTSDSVSGNRVGGLFGAINGTVSACSYKGTVSLLRGTALSSKEASAGLCAGYNNGKVTGCTFEGTVTSTSAAGTSIAAVIGNSGSSSADRNIEDTNVKATLVSGDSTVGVLVGRLNSGTVYCYLGSDGKPVTIDASTTVNGVAVSSTYASVLLGDSKDSPNVSVANVVIR